MGRLRRAIRRNFFETDSRSVENIAHARNRAAAGTLMDGLGCRQNAAECLEIQVQLRERRRCAMFVNWKSWMESFALRLWIIHLHNLWLNC